MSPNLPAPLYAVWWGQLCLLELFLLSLCPSLPQSHHHSPQVLPHALLCEMVSSATRCFALMLPLQQVFPGEHLGFVAECNAKKHAALIA